MAPVKVLAQVSGHRPVAPAVRSVRRATARRASARRAYARSRHSDTDATIISFLTNHPGSNIGDLAKSLNLDPAHVAICLSQLTGTGEIHKAVHGYTTQQPTVKGPG